MTIFRVCCYSFSPIPSSSSSFSHCLFLFSFSCLSCHAYRHACLAAALQDSTLFFCCFFSCCFCVFLFCDSRNSVVQGTKALHNLYTELHPAIKGALELTEDGSEPADPLLHTAGLFKIARQMYLLFQQQTTLERAASDNGMWGPFLEENPACLKAFSLLRMFGPTTCLVAPDSRAGRSMCSAHLPCSLLEYVTATTCLVAPDSRAVGF